MNYKMSVLLSLLLVLTLSACNRHKTADATPPSAEPEAAPATAPMAPEPPPQVNEPPPVVKKDSAAQRLMAGDLQAAGSQAVSGVAALMKSDDGYAVRIEHLRIDGTMPELEVLLSTQTKPTPTNLGNALMLGELKGATGNMNYALSAGIDPAKYPTLVLRERGSGVLFATASLGVQ